MMGAASAIDPVTMLLPTPPPWEESSTMNQNKTVFPPVVSVKYFDQSYTEANLVCQHHHLFVFYSNKAGLLGKAVCSETWVGTQPVPPQRCYPPCLTPPRRTGTCKTSPAKWGPFNNVFLSKRLGPQSFGGLLVVTLPSWFASTIWIYEPKPGKQS